MNTSVAHITVEKFSRAKEGATLTRPLSRLGGTSILCKSKCASVCFLAVLSLGLVQCRQSAPPSMLGKSVAQWALAQLTWVEEVHLRYLVRGSHA